MAHEGATCTVCFIRRFTHCAFQSILCNYTVKACICIIERLLCTRAVNLKPYTLAIWWRLEAFLDLVSLPTIPTVPIAKPKPVMLRDFGFVVSVLGLSAWKVTGT